LGSLNWLRLSAAIHSRGSFIAEELEIFVLLKTLLVMRVLVEFDIAGGGSLDFLHSRARSASVLGAHTNCCTMARCYVCRFVRDLHCCQLLVWLGLLGNSWSSIPVVQSVPSWNESIVLLYAYPCLLNYIASC
jgi:hypothetical protein